jgi:hypothetical protein
VSINASLPDDTNARVSVDILSATRELDSALRHWLQCRSLCDMHPSTLLGLAGSQLITILVVMVTGVVCGLQDGGNCSARRAVI